MYCGQSVAERSLLNSFVSCVTDDVPEDTTAFLMTRQDDSKTTFAARRIAFHFCESPCRYNRDKFTQARVANWILACSFSQVRLDFQYHAYRTGVHHLLSSKWWIASWWCCAALISFSEIKIQTTKSSATETCQSSVVITVTPRHFTWLFTSRGILVHLIDAEGR